MSSLDSNLKSDKCILSLASKYILITQVKSFSKNNTYAFLHRLSKHWTYMLSGMSSPLDRQRYETSLPASTGASWPDWNVFYLFVIDEYLSFTVIYCFVF